MSSKTSNKWNALDIVNSEKWSESNWLSFFQDRLWKMQWKRSDFDKMRDDFDSQTNSVSFYDNYWQLQVNVPLEKSLKEIYMGRTDGKIQYDIMPDWQTDIEQLQPAKYALMFFLDWNRKNNFWKENKRFRDLKSHYGSCIYYTWLRKSISFKFETKDDVEIEGNEDILNENNFNKIEHTEWFFFPKTIHPRDFYIDDNNYWSPDVQNAEDCIMKETLTATELELRYGNSKTFDISWVTYSTDPNPKNKDDQWADMRKIVVYHYFNRVKRTMLLVANNDHIMYKWIYLYNDDKLPFENIQHYTNENRFWGEGIPERVAYLKAYKSEIFQDILAWAEMSSWLHLLTWNDDDIWQDWSLWWRTLNIWRNTWWAEWVQQMNTSPNLNYFVTVLNLLDKQVTVDTGINPLEQFDPWSDKVWIVEIMQANKAIRNKSVDENYNLWLDSVLTMTLSRIQQFAPSLLSEKIKSKDWKKVIKTIFPSIRIDWHKVEKKKGQIIVTKDLWKFWYFDLEPWVVEWVWVKVVTPSTNSLLPILERQKINEYINNFNVLAQVAVTDQTGKMMEELRKSFKFEDLIRWNNDAYQIDVNWLKANTEKDEIAQENIKKIEDLQKLLTINPEENVWEANTPIQQWQIPTPWEEVLPVGEWPRIECQN